MNNKELIERLQKYLLAQEPSIVALACAHMMIDLHRVNTILDLPASESTNLLYRLDRNSEQLKKFIKDGPCGELKLQKVNS